MMSPRKRKASLSQDPLTTQERYLENQLRKRLHPSIKEIALKKSSSIGSYEVQLTLTSGNEEKTLSWQLPLTDRVLLFCEKSDLVDLAQAIMTDLKQFLVS